MRLSPLYVVLSLMVIAAASFAQSEYLIRFQDVSDTALTRFLDHHPGTLELVSEPGKLYKWVPQESLDNISQLKDDNIVFAEKNHIIRIPPNPSAVDSRKWIGDIEFGNNPDGNAYPDNPDIKAPQVQATGTDPLLTQAWGMFVSGAVQAHSTMAQGRNIVVAVTDTGVDYNHNDLINNIWRNKGEIANDGIDNDKNGYIDDVVGWDFYSNDNKPYDLSLDLAGILLEGGNPGHGTHVSGVIAAQLNNAEGTAGVAPQAKIMALRFIGEKGQGTTDAAVKAIDYAVANGANIINASWGGEKDSEPDQALREAIQRAGQKGVLFVVAAGNGRLNSATGTSAGFDNDNDPKPVVPASYDYDNMVAVAAVDAQGKLAEFSNWGQKSVKIGAPGVKILSTVPGNRYQDTILEFGTLKVTWDGTSMASPFVSGALAVLWSQSPTEPMAAIRSKLLSSAAALPALAGKVATGGQLSLK